MKEAYNQFERMEMCHPRHKFSDENKTVPGLSLSPRELLNRVQRGLITPADIADAMQNDDKDADNFPHDEASDLAVQYEVVSAQKEQLRKRIEEIKAQKAKVAKEEKDKLDRLREEEKTAKQAEIINRYLKQNPVSGVRERVAEDANHPSASGEHG